MSRQKCPVCHERLPKRACPALGQHICTVCCATKREVEIKCPADCGYLTTARAHPAAVIQRRQERDLGFLLPLVADLTETQYRLVVLFQSVTAKHAEQAVPSPLDARRRRGFARPPRRRWRRRARASSISTRQCPFRRNASPTSSRASSASSPRRTRRSNRGSNGTRPSRCASWRRAPGARKRRSRAMTRRSISECCSGSSPARPATEESPGTEPDHLP